MSETRTAYVIGGGTPAVRRVTQDDLVNALRKIEQAGLVEEANLIRALMDSLLAMAIPDYDAP